MYNVYALNIMRRLKVNAVFSIKIYPFIVRIIQLQLQGKSVENPHYQNIILQMVVQRIYYI